jgi:hypothetical protein
MAGFNYSCRRVLDAREPLPLRYVMFIQACSAFGGLCGYYPVRMQDVHDALAEAFGFSRDNKPTGEQLVLAVSAMIAARFRLLHMLRESERARRRRKAIGNRAKVPRPFSAQQALDLLRQFAAVRPGSGMNKGTWMKTAKGDIQN